MPQLGNYLITDREHAIIESAHFVVLDWFRDSDRRPFREAIVIEGEALVASELLAATDLVSFRRIANAIRTGQGHLTDNPGPLIAVLRNVPWYVVRPE